MRKSDAVIGTALEVMRIHHANVPDAVLLFAAGKGEVLAEEEPVWLWHAVRLRGKLIAHFAVAAFYHAP